MRGFKTASERKFLKDLKKIKDKQALKRIRVKVEELETLVISHKQPTEIPDIPGMIKLQGHDHYYRIRVGDYRMGISIDILMGEEENIFRFVRCLHRKDIYRYFP